MLNLEDICLVAVGSTKIHETQKAISVCQNHCKFKKSLYLTDAKENFKNCTKIAISKIKSINEYQKFIVKDLPEYLINTDCKFFLIINWDGFIVNPEAWTDEFYDYDYIGAPWPWLNHVCGNGGFCFKSLRFLKTQQFLFSTIDKDSVNNPEDLILSYYNRKRFSSFGCQYAPPEIAYRFSTEYGGYDNYKSFGFHDLKVNKQFQHFIYE